MTFLPITFDRFVRTALLDGFERHALTNSNSFVLPGVGQELALEAQGLTVTIRSGAVLCQGRLLHNETQEAITLSPSTTGWIVLTIDLSKENDSTGTPGEPDYTPVNNQVLLRAVSTLTLGRFGQGDNICDFPLASFETTGTVATIEPSKGLYAFDEVFEDIGEITYKGAGGRVLLQSKPGAMIPGNTASELGVLPPGRRPNQTIETSVSLVPFGEGRLTVGESGQVEVAPLFAMSYPSEAELASFSLEFERED